MLCPVSFGDEVGRVRFRHLGLDEGLSQSTVNCMMQDQQGFLWFGTQDGLNRYDGYKIDTYRQNPEDSTSLGGNFVNCLAMAQGAGFWVGTRNCLNQYNPYLNCFIRYPMDEPVQALHQDSEGYVWIGLARGLGRLNPNTGEMMRFTHHASDSNSISHDRVRVIIPDSPGGLWVGTRNGLNYFQMKTKRFSRFPAHQFGLCSDTINALLLDNAGRLWIGTSGGLCVMDTATRQVTRFRQALLTDNILSLMQDSRGDIWIGTSRGAHRFLPHEGGLEIYRPDPTDPHSLSNATIQCMMEDAGGMLWFGTFVGGANQCDPLTRRFHHHRRQNQEPGSLSDNRIYTIFEDSRHTLWVGTLGGGLNRKEAGSSDFIHYRHDPQNASTLSDDNLRAVIEDSRGALWVGSYNGSLQTFDPVSETFESIDYGNRVRIRSLYFDESGKLWIGSYYSGLLLYDPRTKKTRRFSQELAPRGVIRHFFKDSRGKFWICCNDGLFQYDEASDDFIRFSHQPGDLNSISANATNYIMEHSDGALWVGTFGGLNRYDRETGVFMHFDTRHGLPNDAVYGIFEDRHGRLWMSTNLGITCFDPTLKHFTNYDIRDGLQGSEFNAGAHFLGFDGRFYFGGMNGFNVFHPDSIRQNRYPPPVVFTDFLLFNKSVPPGAKSPLKKNVSLASSITLNHRDYIFALEFTALSYRQPEKNRFMYKLDGFDAEWRMADSRQRRATYTNLPHGDYLFQVKASNDDGYWNSAVASIRVSVLPPFWRTWWFQALLAGSVITLAVVIISWRLRDLEKRNLDLTHQVKERTRDLELKSIDLEKMVDKLERSNAEKDRFFNIIAHDLRSPFNAIASYVRLVNRNIHRFSKEEMIELTQELKESSESAATLLENLLTWSRSQTGNIVYNPRTLPLKELVESTMLPLNGPAQIKKISIEACIPEGVEINADLEMIKTVFRNLISNAIKFTRRGGSITISVRDRHHRIRVEVEDSGIGISPETLNKLFRIDTKISLPGTDGESGSGLGLILCNEFLEKHGSVLNVESELGQGSRFYFTLPKAF